MPAAFQVARCAKHMWEEPCISGANGSGAIFFSGCSLRCVYCQNQAISLHGFGAQVTQAGLVEMMQRLEADGAHNINLVNPTHYALQLARLLRIYRPGVPVVYNCGGYERVETLQALDGLVDIYLPDFKYAHHALAKRYSGAESYPDMAKQAIAEMYRQVGTPVYNADGVMRRGLMVRHLVLPGHTRNSMDVLDWIAEHLPRTVPVSLMGQYTPCGDLSAYPELARRVTRREYEKVCDYLIALGIDQGYVQQHGSADAAYIPAFDLTGVIT